MEDLLNKIVGQIGDLIPSWVPWVAGGSTVGLIVLAVLAPSVLQIAANWLSALSPILRGVASGIVEFVKALWSGFLDMTDNGRSLLFVGAVALAAYLWGYTHGTGSRTLLPPSNSVHEAIVPLPSKRPPDEWWRRFLQD